MSGYFPHKFLFNYNVENQDVKKGTCYQHAPFIIIRLTLF